MKKVVAAIYFFTQIAFAQPEIGWQKTIGGFNNDYMQTIVATGDGGYLFAGSSESDLSGEKTENSRGLSDYWLLKTDALGNILWQRTTGGTGGDILSAALQTVDGSYIVAGRSDSNNNGEKTEASRGSTDYWVVKLDASGQITWDKTIGGNWPEEVRDILQTPDGGYIVSGISRSGISGDKTLPTKGLDDLWLVKLTADGQIDWQKDFGGDKEEIFSSLTATGDGGYLLGCHSFSGISGDRTVAMARPFDDAWLIKLDATGEIVWQNAYPMGEFTKVKEANDGGILLAGSASGLYYLRSVASFQYYSLIVKLDAAGNDAWHHRTMPVSGDCVVSDFIETENGDIYFTSNVTGLSNVEALTKIHADGSPAWNRPLVSTDGAGNYANTLRETEDHGIIVGLSSNGNIGGDKSEMARGGLDYWVIKFEPEALAVNEPAAGLFVIAPNPVADYLAVISSLPSNYNIDIYNAAGQLVAAQQLNTVNNGMAFPFATGIYFAKLTDATTGQTQTIKIAKH